ncbi:hypothetical protein [Paracoccus sp. (in: a-proteobacteria)]|uniref:hypothetical protein n=1 Tax=Paracoccus sp. TaxID=267 RepID=UPI004058E8C6
MLFLNYPTEIWLAVLIAVIVRLKSSLTLGWFGALTTVIVAAGSGVLLYEPLADLCGLSSNTHTMLAVLIALTAENLMKMLVDYSSRADAVMRFIKAVIRRDPTLLFEDDDKKG